MAALTGALLGVGCNASWLANNRTARGVALPAAMDSTRLLYNAHYYQLMGRPEIALKELQQAHEVDPANLKVVDALAQMYQEQGQFQRAQELYQETLKRYGENRALHNNWCFSYYLQGDLGRAEFCLQEALARDPGNMAARNNLGLLWCRQGKLAEAKRLWEEAEVPALAQTRMNQALAFLGMSAPAYYAKLAEPGPGAPLADSSAKSPAAAVPPTVKAAPAARPLAAAPKAEVKVAAKATEPGLALPQQPAASRQPKSAAPAIIASQDGSLLVAEGQTSARATPAAGLAESATAPAPQKPAAPVLVTTQAGSLAAEPPITAKAATPAAPAATRPTAGLTEAAKVAPPPAPPVAASSGKFVAAQGKTLVTAPVPQKPAAPVLVTTQAGSLAAEPPITAKAAAPAAPAATRPTAGLTEAAKVAPPPAPPVAASSGKSVAAQGKTLVTAPARPLAAATKAKVKNAAKAAAPRTILTAAERVKAGIEILNGNGTQDLASLTRTMLFQEVFNVARIGNYIDFGAESTVIYYRPGMERVAGVLHSEIFPEAQLMESSKLRKGVAIEILLGRDLLAQPQTMARLRGEEAGASPQKPQPRPTASQRPATSLILAAAAASGTARSPLQGPPPTPAKTLVQPGVPLATPTAEELIASVIEIRNGTWARMLAHQTRDRLSQQGFHVGMIGNHIDFGAETTVIYYRPGTEKVARALNSQIFPGAQLVESSRLRKGIAIKILLGRDLLAQPQTMVRLIEKGHEDH
ncbi:MAG: LytR C-terminal domain-containing protein [Desulfobaccales bacterium]